MFVYQKSIRTSLSGVRTDCGCGIVIVLGVDAVGKGMMPEKIK